MKLNWKKYIFHFIIASIPIYWAALYYIELVTHSKSEELAVAATICFFGSVFAGRFILINWEKQQPLPRSLLSILITFIGADILWMFIHADFGFRWMPAIDMLLYWLPFVALGVATGMLVKLLMLSQHLLEKANIKEAQSQTELQLLQSQLSPHFLFNTLNNLYGLSLTQHQQIPPLILKLSDMLRYAVYDASERYVSLKAELDYIRNYIEFEKIRLSDRLVLDVSLEDVNGQLKIAPMLLIVFIENAFKHSRNTTDHKIYIDIVVSTTGDHIVFAVRNSFITPPRQDISDKHKGLGLANTNKRLELLYPGRYNLDVTNSEGWYTVLLKLKTI